MQGHRKIFWWKVQNVEKRHFLDEKRLLANATIIAKKIILIKKSQLNTTQLYKLSFIQLLQININKKETYDDRT